MPIEKEAARRAERPYTGCEELSNKSDLDDELYRILCRLDRARFLQGLSSPRGSPWRFTWNQTLSYSDLLQCSVEESATAMARDTDTGPLFDPYDPRTVTEEYNCNNSHSCFLTVGSQAARGPCQGSGSM
jgi:hypothetical protein